MDQIDAAIRGGMSLGVATKTFPGLVRGTLGRHRQKCLGIQAGDTPETPRETARPVAETGIQLSPRPFAVPNPGDDAPTRPRAVVTAFVERRCVELRAAGKSYQAISAELGIDKDTAVDVVERVLLRTARGTDSRADAARALDLERIDKLLAGCWARATDPDQGSTTDAEGEASYSPGQDKAIERATKLLERRAKLLGLDAPTVSISLSHPKVREELERATGELYALLAAALAPWPEAMAAVVAAMKAWRERQG